MKLKNILLLITLSIFSSYGNAESVWDKSIQSLTAPTEIVVYRSPSCGCCHKWIKHLEKHRFTVKDMVTEDVNNVKQIYGVPGKMASCHTAIVDGYVVEGHVPATDIITLLTTRPKIVGISVPGMVSGTPGMEMGAKKDPFKVISFDSSGKFSDFNKYENY